MRILTVNHGYPMRYNAGSEVYARNLTLALAGRGHDMAVFSRYDDPHQPEHRLIQEQDGSIPHWLVNAARSQHRFQNDTLDAAFESVLDHFGPEVVHFHHLNHLSIGLPGVARRAGAAVVFTVHDFWLCCPRGQRISWGLDGEPWALCPCQDDHRCAERCYARCHTGLEKRRETDLAYWAGWVGDRMAAVQAQLVHMDRLVCPSSTVADALVERFPEVADRIILQDYGFPPLRLAEPTPRDRFTFGYIGTHTAPKGLDQLIRAFMALEGEPELIIWGRHRGQATAALKHLAAPHKHRIHFEDEYHNGELGSEVLPRVDAIVVPSIWLENSPLVIHEAQQARLCVVTADAGGMRELVAHGENGLLFRHRDEGDLRRQLQRLVDEPGLAERRGARGYLRHPTGEVPSVNDEAARFDALYGELVEQVRS